MPLSDRKLEGGGKEEDKINVEKEGKNVRQEDENDVWREVRKKIKPPHREKTEEEPRSVKTHVFADTEKEELDFQFDEDLQVPTGRHNTFSEW